VQTDCSVQTNAMGDVTGKRPRGSTLPNVLSMPLILSRPSSRMSQATFNTHPDESEFGGTEDDQGQQTIFSDSTLLYVQRCKAFKMIPDPSVLTCLETGWHVLALSPTHAVEGSLLPLVDVLGGKFAICTHVRELRVVPAPSLRSTRQLTFSGDIDARCLSKVFASNRTIVELDLSHVGLGPEGIKEIASIIEQNSTLQVIRLCNNPGGRSAYGSLEVGIKANKALRVLDVSSNRLGFDVIQRLRAAGKREPPLEDLQVLGHGNHVVEETLNTITHGLGFVIALFGVVALQWHSTASLRVWWSSLIYGITLLSMYASSTIFHASFDSHVDSFDFWKMCDHSAIYLLIAGSVTPFVFVALHESPLALFVSFFQWVVAFIGIAFGLYATHHRMRHKLKIEMTLNFMQGFAVLLIYDELGTVLKPEVVRMLLYSGACYVMGAVFFVAEHTVHPVAHAIWHLFVIAGSTIHYFSVLQFVMALEFQEKTAGATLSQVVCRIVSNDLPVLTTTIQDKLASA